jgi:hypothetical protein
VPTTKATTKERRGTPSLTQKRHICEIHNLAPSATKILSDYLAERRFFELANALLRSDEFTLALRERRWTAHRNLGEFTQRLAACRLGLVKVTHNRLLWQ